MIFKRSHPLDHPGFRPGRDLRARLCEIGSRGWKGEDLEEQSFSGFLSLWDEPVQQYVQPFPDFQYQGKVIKYKASVVDCMNDIRYSWGLLDNQNASNYLYLFTEINTILCRLTPTQIKSFTGVVQRDLNTLLKSIFDPYYDGHLDNLLISANTIRNPIVKSERQQQDSTSQSPSSPASTGRERQWPYLKAGPLRKMPRYFKAGPSRHPRPTLEDEANEGWNDLITIDD